MLKVWGRRNSFNVQKVMWLIGELGLSYEHIPAGGSFGVVGTKSFRTMNPHGLVPVVEDGGAVIWESHAIIRYLAARYGRGSFWDDDPAVRSQTDRWMDWTLATLQPDLMGRVFRAFYRTPEARRDWPTIRSGIARSAEHFKLLDNILANQTYLAGDQFSIAYIPAGATLFRYHELDIERPVLPHVSAWYRRLQERPNYREHVMVPFAALYGCD